AATRSHPAPDPDARARETRYDDREPVGVPRGLLGAVGEAQAGLEAGPLHRRRARPTRVVVELVLGMALEPPVVVGVHLLLVDDAGLPRRARGDEDVGRVRLDPELGVVDAEAARDPASLRGQVEVFRESLDRAQVDDVDPIRDDPYRPVGVM